MERDPPKIYKVEVCRYYVQGRCRFGGNCHYSHQGFTQAFMIRHAQSEYNQAALHYPDRSFVGEEAKQELQLNQNYIDCGVTEGGALECQMKRMPHQLKTIDIVFVSPLNRALQTAQIVIRSNRVKVGRVIVLPQLTEVLSKICDFSTCLKEKRQKYRKFDFSEMNRFVKKSQFIKDEDHWQDVLVDQQHFGDILVKQTAGFRYMAILEKIFPQPLENSERCFARSMQALQIMKNIMQKGKAKRVLIVSHNRILKYLDGRLNNGRAPSLQNLQIRKLIF